MTGAKAFFGRLVLAHFLAYPVAFLTAIGSLPLAIHLKGEELLDPEQVGAKTRIVADVARDMGLSPTNAAQVEMVLEVLLWATLAVLVVIHLAAIPWGIEAARAANGRAVTGWGKRAFVVVAALTTFVVVLVGTAGWIWIFTL